MELTCIIEMPSGSIYKYEKSGNSLVLDRVNKLPVPHNYGYIPNTLAEDGDALDIFVLSSFPIHPNVQVTANVLGAYKCLDNGVNDHKLVAALKGDRYVENSEAVIKFYLNNYKKDFMVLGWVGPEEAMKLYRETQI